MKKMIWILGIIVLILIATGLLGLKSLLPDKNDLRELSWVEAFEELQSNLEKKYPFTEWKGVNWDGLYRVTAQKIAAAEAEKDYEAYYLALREYAYSIPDGHVAFTSDDNGPMEEAVAGGYGLNLIRLDDQRVIVYDLLDGSPAEDAGVKWGAEIISWSNLSIDDALENSKVLWAKMPPATHEGRELEQLRFLVRGSVGNSVLLEFVNVGEDDP